MCICSVCCLRFCLEKSEVSFLSGEWWPYIIYFISHQVLLHVHLCCRILHCTYIQCVILYLSLHHSGAWCQNGWTAWAGFLEWRLPSESATFCSKGLWIPRHPCNPSPYLKLCCWQFFSMSSHHICCQHSISIASNCWLWALFITIGHRWGWQLWHINN